MNCLLDAKAKFLTIWGITEGIEVDIDKGKKKVFVTIIWDQNGYDLYHDHTKEEQQQIELMLKELKDPSLCSTCIDFMRIHKPESPDQVYEVKTSIKCIKERPIDKLEISPILREVVISIRQRVKDQLYCNNNGHEYAKNRRSLLHRIVIFEDEPLWSYSNRQCNDDQHECHA